MNKPTVHDIAKVAGVSLATVDRVLNARPGVRERTVARVQEAVSQLGYVRDTNAANLARRRTYRFGIILPDGKGQFLRGLRAAIDEAAAGPLGERCYVRQTLVPSRDHTALVRALNALERASLDGVAIMANETPVVRDAIARLTAAGTAVVSLVSDQPNSERDHFVGFDNVAAGRTAAVLLGRFVGNRRGKVIVVATTMQSRDMAERRFGFDQIMTESFPNLVQLPSIEGHDDAELTYRLTRFALEKNPDAVALYSVGASINGIGMALSERSDRDIVCIDHELTENSRRLLEEGIIDGVINQNTGHLARSALRLLRAHCDGAEPDLAQERIRVDIVIRENLPDP
ncbi:MAG: LacI family DNA-binding transcriptional regulator [Pseudomonadota bacterium]